MFSRNISGVVGFKELSKFGYGRKISRIFPVIKYMSDEACERFDSPTVGGNLVYRSGTAMSNLLTGI
jgi:hypothetical protein